MYTIKTLNAISPVGLAKLPANQFEIDNEAAAPQGILVRSADMHDAPLPDSLLAIARGAELTEQLTTLAKTGLCALTEEEVCALENYAYTWSPGAAAWRAPFEKNPRGFGDADPTAEDTSGL